MGFIKKGNAQPKRSDTDYIPKMESVPNPHFKRINMDDLELINELQVKLDMAVKTLEFYEEPINWKTCIIKGEPQPTPIEHDRGYSARKTIKNICMPWKEFRDVFNAQK